MQGTWGSPAVTHVALTWYSQSWPTDSPFLVPEHDGLDSAICHENGSSTILTMGREEADALIIRRSVPLDRMEYLVPVLIALVAYAALPPLVSVATREAPSTVVLFLGTAVFLLLTLGVMLATGTADPAYATAPAAVYVYVAGVCLAVGILAYYAALARGPVSVVVPIYGMFIVGSSAIGIVFLNEPATPARLGGIGCAVLAVYLSATEDG